MNEKALPFFFLFLSPYSSSLTMLPPPPPAPVPQWKKINGEKEERIIITTHSSRTEIKITTKTKTLS
jgi:hypothetical protein